MSILFLCIFNIIY